MVWPPPGRPVSANLIDELLDKVAVDAIFVAPSTLEELSQSQASLEKLKRVKYALFAGGEFRNVETCLVTKRRD